MAKAISLVAAMVAVAMFTSGAQGYSVEPCSTPDGDCPYTSDQQPQQGDEVTFWVDVDTVVPQGNSGFCGAYFYVPFSSDEHALVEAELQWRNTEAVVACADRWLPDSYNMPEHDRMAYCIFEDLFFNSGDDLLADGAEIKLTFKKLVPGETTIGAGAWSVYKWGEGANCGDRAESGTMAAGVRFVPEPAVIAGLAACVPLLWVLGRRHARRNQ